MTKIDQNMSDIAPVNGPGRALKEGRESKGYSIAQVADELHLRPSIVSAIEEENYELLPGDIFLKGYIRSYSRIVGLDEQSMVDLLDQQLNYEAGQQACKEEALGKAKRKKRSKHAVLVLVVTAAIGVALYFWSERLGDNHIDLPVTALTGEVNGSVSDKSEEQPLPDEALVVEDANVVTSQRTKPIDDVSADHKSEMVDSVQLIDATSDVESNGDEKIVEGGVSAPSFEEPEPEPEPEPDTISKQPVLPLLDQTSTAEGVTNTNSGENMVSIDTVDTGHVRVVFSGDCWFTLKNGDGKTVYAALKKAGDEVNYSGPLPFKMVVGAVSAVNVYFEQSLFDFSTVRVWNNRAEIELTH